MILIGKSSFNRTIEELKQKLQPSPVAHDDSFNRTIEELKLDFSPSTSAFVPVLIAP